VHEVASESRPANSSGGGAHAAVPPRDRSGSLASDGSWNGSTGSAGEKKESHKCIKAVRWNQDPAKSDQAQYFFLPPGAPDSECRWVDQDDMAANHVRALGSWSRYHEKQGETVPPTPGVMSLVIHPREKYEELCWSLDTGQCNQYRGDVLVCKNWRRCGSHQHQECMPAEARLTDALFKRCLQESRVYRTWECMSCKTCTICRRDNADRSLICDGCDQMQHYDCIPEGDRPRSIPAAKEDFYCASNQCQQFVKP
jgi:hypothetical protein